MITKLENKAFQVDHTEFQKQIDDVKKYYEEEQKEK